MRILEPYFGFEHETNNKIKLYKGYSAGVGFQAFPDFWLLVCILFSSVFFPITFYTSEKFIIKFVVPSIIKEYPTK